MGRVIHFEILGDDPARLAEFYRQTLGWEFQSWDGGHPYVLLATGPKDEDGIDGAIMPRFFPQAVINTALVESLDEALARIEAAGGKKVWGGGRTRFRTSERTPTAKTPRATCSASSRPPTRKPPPTPDLRNHRRLLREALSLSVVS